MRMLSLRKNYANVASTLALVVALGGTGAYAANTIGSRDIKPNAVKSSDIGKGQVKTSDLGNNAVTSDKVKDGQLRLKDLHASAKSSASQAHRLDVSPPPLDPGTHSLATLPLQAGQYVVLASTGFDSLGGDATVDCRLRVGVTVVAARFVTSNGIGGYNCVTHTVVKLPAPGSVVLEMEVGPGDSIRVGDPTVTAIKVGSVSDVEVTG